MAPIAFLIVRWLSVGCRCKCTLFRRAVVGDTAGAMDSARTDPTSERTKLSPPQIAKRWGIHPRRVLSWIRSGELRAINISEGGQRPRYLVDVADLVAFESRRSVLPSDGKTSRGGRRGTQTDVVDFYPDGVS